jgi:feruloyl esterase
MMHPSFLLRRILAVSFFIAISFFQFSFSQTLTRVKDFGTNPGKLKMYMYTPSGFEKKANVPLVVVLHGCLQNAKKVSKQSGWNKLAELHGFNVLYPEQRIFNNPAKCFCWYKSEDIEKGKGENYSIKQMIDYTTDNYPTDTAKIFVTGLSAGAAMAVTMMADYPKTFNAGAIYAGAPYKVATNIFTATMAMYGWRRKSPKNWGEYVRQQNPDYKGNYPHMIIYHGNADVVVNKRNGYELMKQWTNLHQVSTEPTQIIKRFAGVKSIEKSVFKNSEGKDVITYYRVKHLGHTLLVDPGKCETKGGRIGLFSNDRNYFSTYWTAIDFGLIQPSTIAGKTVVTNHEKGVEFSAPQIDGIIYKWNFPKDCIPESNLNSSTIKLTWGKKSGNVDLITIDKNKCKTTYLTLPVKVEPNK